MQTPPPSVRSKKISVLIPAYNESGNISMLVKELDEFTASLNNPSIREEAGIEGCYEWEYLFVNDGSSDDTLQVIRNMRKSNERINYVNLSRNFGKENALLAGMDYVTGDAVIIMDADLQHPVSVFAEMIHWWEQGYDDVYGQRESRGAESGMRKHLSLLYYSILQKMTKIEILKNVGDFRLLDRRVVNAIRELRESQRYTKGLYCWVGYDKKAITFQQRDRMEGKSSFNILSLLNLAIDGITCFTISPLRLSTIFGAVVALVSILYMIFICVKTVFFGEAIQGFPTIMCAILFLSGVQLVVLGIMGEYIGKIYMESKRRPVYIVESFNDKKI